MGKLQPFSGGRLTLTNAVISNLPTFYVHLSYPKGSVRIKTGVEGFYLGGGIEKNIKILVSGGILILPLEKGGLGVDNLKKGMGPCLSEVSSGEVVTFK